MTLTWLAVAIGAVAGLLGGMFGIGGGIITVPGLVLLLRLSQYEASGTSVAVIVATSASAVLVLAGEGEVDWAAAALLIVGGAFGAWTGTSLVHRVPEHVLTGLFTVVLMAAAVRMWV